MGHVKECKRRRIKITVNIKNKQKDIHIADLFLAQKTTGTSISGPESNR